MSMRARICDVIYSRPGITQLEIAQSIYGPLAYQGLVKAVCRQLLREGHVARSGKGGPRDPFTYTWVRDATSDASMAQRSRRISTGARIGGAPQGSSQCHI